MSVYQDFPHMTHDQVDEMLNTISVDYFEFARYTSLYSRAYGVITSELTGIEETYKDYVMTPCAQRALYRTLYSVQNETERLLGYNLSKRYHFDFTTYDSHILTTRWPGVTRLNASRVWYDLPQLSAVPIDPYIQRNVTVITTSGFPEAFIDSRYVANPLNIWLRKAANDAAYVIDTTRKPRRSGNDWVVAINNARVAYDGMAVNVQDRELVSVVIPKPTLPAGATLVPVYQGTYQQIPVHSVVDDGTNLTFYLYIYTLVDPAFTDRVVDLVAGEFFKLLPEIAFAYYLEEARGVEVVVYFGDDANTLTETPNAKGYSVHAALVDGEVGLYYLILKKDGKIICERPGLRQFDVACDTFRTCVPTAVYVKIYYITEPSALPEKFYRQVDSARNAIIHKTAAELPMDDCLCRIEVGFIGMAQRMYGDTHINPITGTETFKYKHGHRHGQIEYKAIMDRMVLFRRPLIVRNFPDYN